MTNDADAITIYSDYVCPFCYLGRKSLEQYQATREAPLDLEWHPFDLRASQRGPDGEIDESVETGKDEAYYEHARENVERLQAKYDVEMVEPLVRDVDSRNAQLASVFVQMEHPDDWLGFDRAIFDALWRDGRNVGDPDVLADIALDCGIDPAAVRSALTDELVARRTEDQWEAARIRGITGVPTFVYGDHSARGAVPPEQFERLVEGV